MVPAPGLPACSCRSCRLCRRLQALFHGATHAWCHLPALHAPRNAPNCRYETQNHLWVILEYCVGGDLLTLLRSDGRLPEASGAQGPQRR